MKTNCQSVQDALLREELNREQQAHLACCTACADFQRLIELAQRPAEGPEPAAALDAQIIAYASSRPAARRFPSRILQFRWVSIAAAAVFVVVLGVNLLRHPPATPHEAPPLAARHLQWDSATVDIELFEVEAELAFAMMDTEALGLIEDTL